MMNPTPRSTGGVFLMLMVCLGLAAVAGCKTETASTSSPAIRLANAREPEWGLLTGVRPVLAESGKSGTLLQSDQSNPGSDYGSDLRMIDAARGDLRRRVQDLAEEQIARETADMRENANAQVDERARELRNANDREYQEFADRILSESSIQARQVELDLQQPRLNLRLKLAAVNARRGMFGGAIDAQAQIKAESLKAELAQLDQRRQDMIQALRDSETREMSELKKKQQSGVDAETARLRADAEARIAEDAKERRDRLNADLSQSVSEDSPRASSAVRLAMSARANDRLSVSSRNAADLAENRFDRDLAAARASVRKRQEDIRRRELVDRALMNKR
jgi:hypothetical protein